MRAKSDLDMHDSTKRTAIVGTGCTPHIYIKEISKKKNKTDFSQHSCTNTRINIYIYM